MENGFTSAEIPGGSYGYFFQKSQDSSTPSALVCSVLADVLSHRRLEQTQALYEVTASIGGYMDRYKRATDCPLDATWRIFESLMMACPAFVLIVDGIDECPDDKSLKKVIGIPLPDS